MSVPARANILPEGLTFRASTPASGRPSGSPLPLVLPDVPSCVWAKGEEVTTTVRVEPGCLVCNMPIGSGRHSRTIYCTSTCRQRATSRRRRGLPISDRPVDRKTASDDANRRRVAESEALRLDAANTRLRKELAEARRRNDAHEIETVRWATLAAKRNELLAQRLTDATWTLKQLTAELTQSQKDAGALRAQVSIDTLWRATGLTRRRILELWSLAAKDMRVRREHTAEPDIYDWEREMIYAYKQDEKNDIVNRRKAANK